MITAQQIIKSLILRARRCSSAYIVHSWLGRLLMMCWEIMFGDYVIDYECIAAIFHLLQASTRVNFVSTRKTGNNYYHKRRHKCCQNICSYIRFTYLFTRRSLCRPNNVEFSGKAEK